MLDKKKMILQPMRRFSKIMMSKKIPNFKASLKVKCSRIGPACMKIQKKCEEVHKVAGEEEEKKDVDTGEKEKGVDDCYKIFF